MFDAATANAYPDLEPVYSVDSLATLFDVNQRTIRNMINRGDLESVRLGRLIRIPRQAVVELLTPDESGG